ncbi:MAG TPA: hypothetical protein VME41_14070 [Stellaceae bacterium]|nr:hypothetical protein [Stellaceae bacterium]
MTIESLRDPDAAPYSRAAALRVLHSYRAARDRAQDRGADMTLLPEAPDFATIEHAYAVLVDEALNAAVNGPRQARAAIDLLAQIVADQALGDVLDEGPIASAGKDHGDALRLIANLSGWVNKLDIAEAVDLERKARGLPPAPAPGDTEGIVAELLRQSIASGREAGRKGGA